MTTPKKKINIPDLDVVKFLAGIGETTTNFELAGYKHQLVKDEPTKKKQKISSDNVTSLPLNNNDTISTSP